MTTDNNSTEEPRGHDFRPGADEGIRAALRGINESRHGAFSSVDIAFDAIHAAYPVIAAAVRADERTRIATEVEAEGREEVGWLAKHASDDIDRARLIGAGDAYKAALRVIRESAAAPEPRITQERTEETSGGDS